MLRSGLGWLDEEGTEQALGALPGDGIAINQLHLPPAHRGPGKEAACPGLLGSPQQPGDFPGSYPFGLPGEQYPDLFEPIRFVDRI